MQAGISACDQRSSRCASGARTSASSAAAGAQSQSSGFEYLPVYSKVDTFERKIAITVDDCFQVGNLQTIANSAVKNGGKLTLFPIGENLTKNGMEHTLYVSDDAHVWKNWRLYLNTFAQLLFK